LQAVAWSLPEAARLLAPKSRLSVGMRRCAPRACGLVRDGDAGALVVVGPNCESAAPPRCCPAPSGLCWCCHPAVGAKTRLPYDPQAAPSANDGYANCHIAAVLFLLSASAFISCRWPRAAKDRHTGAQAGVRMVAVVKIRVNRAWNASAGHVLLLFCQTTSRALQAHDSQSSSARTRSNRSCRTRPPGGCGRSTDRCQALAQGYEQAVRHGGSPRPTTTRLLHDIEEGGGTSAGLCRLPVRTDLRLILAILSLTCTSSDGRPVRHIAKRTTLN